MALHRCLLLLLMTVCLNGCGQDSIPSYPSPVEFYPQYDRLPRPLNLMDVALQVKETPLTLEMTGKFVVKVLVDAKGNYQNHLVLASPHWMVTERHVACLHLLKFEAATVAGRPKACWVVLPFSRCMR